MKHKHAELIKAWADGATIEFYDEGHWYEKIGHDWYEDAKYRIKPEPKPDVNYYAYTTKGGTLAWEKEQYANLKLTFDGETGELKSAEVLK